MIQRTVLLVVLLTVAVGCVTSKRFTDPTIELERVQVLDRYLSVKDFQWIKFRDGDAEVEYWRSDHDSPFWERVAIQTPSYRGFANRMYPQDEKRPGRIFPERISPILRQCERVWTKPEGWHEICGDVDHLSRTILGWIERSRQVFYREFVR